ncbi:MAG TPA: hypothetical protein VG206_18385 [Terriglobia bacterium]|nr:hypothetical protein [Terriglobia bacterium]
MSKRCEPSGRRETLRPLVPPVENPTRTAAGGGRQWRGVAVLVATLFLPIVTGSLARGQAAPPDASPPAAPQASAAAPQTAQTSASTAPSTSKQSASLPAVEPTGWLGFEQLQYGVSALGNVIIEDTDIGYGVTEHLSGDIGLPVIFTRSPFSPVLSHDYYWSALLGEPYIDVKYTNTYHDFNYTSVLTGTIPASGEDKIYSTGRFGVDLFNHIEEPFGNYTPFLNIGFSNGAVNRFVMPRPYATARPYQTLGFLADAEAGLQYRFSKGRLRGVSVAVSAYGLEPAGAQKVYSRLVFPYSDLAGDGHHDRFFDSTFETTSNWVIIDQTLQPTVIPNSKLSRDNGFSGTVDITRWHNLDVQLAYTRSMHYDLDVYTATFTFDARELLRSVVPHRR